ncbi:hypothetical protein T4D_12278 [Trichinella pseudospiralis]|uniref:Uncharacterized protein n=1 Tax=Trichinella pseudospiralis TaxID=6337 RepID=A0A0V1FG52_TRIPS|nr:hypothetical protein T4D_12278 [Trichinella pseudospiralis]
MHAELDSSVDIDQMLLCVQNLQILRRTRDACIAELAYWKIYDTIKEVEGIAYHVPIFRKKLKEIQHSLVIASALVRRLNPKCLLEPETERNFGKIRDFCLY